MQPVRIEILLNDRLSPGARVINAEIDKIHGTAQRVNREMDNTSATADRAKRALSGLVSAFAVKELVSNVTRVRGEFQQLEVAFNTMLGSAERADALMNQLVRTAATTPFGLSDVANGAKQLLAYGLEAEKVNGTLIRLGDIAAGLSMPLNDLVYLYGTTMAQGRLYTQDLNQFTGRGIPMLRELAKQFGVAESQVKGLVEAGKVGFPEVQRVIEDLTNEGGTFGGLMEAQSKTITGQISNIEDAIASMFNAIGQSSEGAINTTLATVSSLVENYQRTGRILAGLIATYGAYRTAIMAVTAAKGWATAAEALHYNWLLLVERAQKALNATMLANPYVLVATAIAGVVAAMVSMKTEAERLQEAEQEYEAQKQRTIEAEQEHARRLEQLASIAADEALSTDTRRKALYELEMKYPDIFAKYDTEYEKLKNIRRIKEEIAALEGKRSINIARNELDQVEQRINQLQAKKNAAVNSVMQSTAGAYAYTSGGLTEKENAELKNLLNRRAALAKQVERDNVQAYLTNLTGISNNTLAAEIKTREELIAKLQLADNKNLRGKVVGGGAAGSYTQQELEAQLQVLRAEQNRRNETTQSSSAWLQQAKQKYQDALKAYNSFITDGAKQMTKQEFETKAKELKEAADTAKKELDNISSDNTKKSKRSESKVQDQVSERQKQIDAYYKAIADAETQAQLDIEQRQLENEQDSFNKRIALIALNYRRLILENQQREKEMIDALANTRVNEYNNANPNATKAQLNNYRASLYDQNSPNYLSRQSLSKQQQEQLLQYEQLARQTQLNETQRLYDELLKRYENFDARRSAIDRQYNADRMALEAAPMDTSAREAAIAELERRRIESIKNVNDEEVRAMQQSSSLLVELFSDSADKSDKEIRDIITRTNELLQYLRVTPENDITASMGFSASQLKSLKASPEQIKAITEQVSRLQETANKTNPFRSLANALKELFAKGGDEPKKLEANLKRAGAAAAETASLIGGIAGKMSEMFAAAGNEDLSATASGIEQAMTSVGNIASGFAQGGLIGGIAAAVGEAIGYITQAFQAEAIHQQALQKILEETTAQQQAYNLALLEQNLLLEEANTIFGNLEYSKASNATQVLVDAYKALNEALAGTNEQQKRYAKESFDALAAQMPYFAEALRNAYSQTKDLYSGLAEIQIKVGHVKTGLFGWGKGRDVFGSILDAYPELIDSAGNFNRALAESIMSTREFADGSKEALQYIIDIYDQVKETEQAIADYLTGIFGDLGNSLADALTEAFRSGTDAAQAFSDSVASMLEQLGQQMIYSALFDQVIQSANDSMLAVMKNVNLTQEEKFSQYIDILSAMTSGILANQDDYNALMKAYQDMAAQSGIKLWQPEATTQSAKAGSFNAMSQEQGTKLEGLFTSGQIHWASMDEQLTDVSSKMTLAMDHLQGIRENTYLSAQRLEDIKSDIARLLRDGLKVK